MIVGRIFGISRPQITATAISRRVSIVAYGFYFSNICKFSRARSDLKAKRSCSSTSHMSDFKTSSFTLTLVPFFEGLSQCSFASCAKGKSPCKSATVGLLSSISCSASFALFILGAMVALLDGRRVCLSRRDNFLSQMGCKTQGREYRGN
jgi:hypothetical protein